MIMAMRSSSDAIVALTNAQAINPLKCSVDYTYPAPICGVGKCGLRALFSLLGEMTFNQITTSHEWMRSEKIDNSKLKQLFHNHHPHSTFGSDIIYLRNHHWVSLSTEYYTDDAHRWKVLDHGKVLEILRSMEGDHHSIKDQDLQLIATDKSKILSTSTRNTNQQCTSCIHRDIPCIVSSRPGYLKPTKCDGCTDKNLSCHFAPPLSKDIPLRLSKSCIHCQLAHQTCVMSDSVPEYIRCEKHDHLICYFAPSSQGRRFDIKRSMKNLTEMANEEPILKRKK